MIKLLLESCQNHAKVDQWGCLNRNKLAIITIGLDERNWEVQVRSGKDIIFGGKTIFDVSRNYGLAEKLVVELLLSKRWFLNTEFCHLTPKSVYIQIQS